MTTKYGKLPIKNNVTLHSLVELTQEDAWRGP